MGNKEIEVLVVPKRDELEPEGAVGGWHWAAHVQLTEILEIRVPVNHHWEVRVQHAHQKRIAFDYVLQIHVC